jgi:hypothetical protein
MVSLVNYLDCRAQGYSPLTCRGQRVLFLRQNLYSVWAQGFRTQQATSLLRVVRSEPLYQLDTRPQSTVYTFVALEHL